ncbi:hypothetical protein PHSY_003603 [Pseudozyma hubeiensis SY62]|uniref:Transmembrane protein n=1 Tax=Pseudozyma hubeiensis (strain SY62) TaxID=1305764 RepID=R9P3Z9_PSEHS|nr:hypothetical protein PHSY_003603 [Pseudozyma hubeiensis SY62]GAC96024.1 hypothetical protein PHSY_003603 [Pseudozyma hubeiensis SY62]
MRYTTLFAISLGLYATWHRSGGACLPFRELCTLLVQFSVSAVLGWRTVGIWQKDPRIIVIVFLLLTTLMVFSSLLVLSLEPKKLPNGACVLIDGGTYAFFPLAWFYAGTVLYDTIVIVLSAYRLCQHHRRVAMQMRGDAGSSSEGGARWTKWVRLRWNNLTPLLFRLTANGLLYLGFSTAFNIACYIAGYQKPDHAQDLMILYSAVMWIVCQHLMLLEIKAVWRDRLVRGKMKDAEADETDKLIARILQASWSFKSPPPMASEALTRNVEVVEVQSQELVLSLSIDSCLRAAPGSAGGAASASQSNKATSTSSPPTGRYWNDSEIDPSSVHQLHDFRPPSPRATLDPLAGSSTLGLIKHPLMDTARHNDPPNLAAPTMKREHLEVKDVRDSDSTNAVSALEVADMLANMSDDAKTTALELAGMDSVHPVAIASLDASRRHLSSRSADRRRAAWIIGPPL